MQKAYNRYGVFLILVAFVVEAAQAMHHGLSGDVYWQWAAGRLMLQRGAVLHRDPFSYTLWHHPWVADEWGYEVMMAWAVRWLGPGLLWFFSAGWADLALMVTWLRLVRHDADWMKAGVILVVAAIALEPFIRDRPQTLSYFLFALTFWILAAAEEHPARLWTLPPLLWLWTWCHGSFLLGYTLVLSDGVWRTFPRLRHWGRQPAGLAGSAAGIRLRIGVLLVSVALSWINPFGWRLWSYAWHVSTSPIIRNTISEWQSPNFHAGILKAATWLPVMGLGLLVFRGRRPISPFQWFWTGALFLATLQSVRFLPYFGLQWGIPVMEGTQGMGFRRLRGSVVALSALAVSVFLMVSRPMVPPRQAAPSEPTGAVHYYLSHHLQGRIFNFYVWGGYLIWRGFRVFIDGRTDLYLQDHILSEYLAVQNVTENPNTWLRVWRVRYVLWPPGTPLATFLLAAPASWRLVYQSQNALLFRHVGSWGMPVTLSPGG